MFLDDGIYIDTASNDPSILRLSVLQDGKLVDGQIDDQQLPVGSEVLARLTKKVAPGRFLAFLGGTQETFLNLKGNFQVGDLVVVRLKRPALEDKLEPKDALYVPLQKEQLVDSGDVLNDPKAKPGIVLKYAKSLAALFLEGYQTNQNQTYKTITALDSAALETCPPPFKKALKISHQSWAQSHLNTLWDESFAVYKELNETDNLLIEEMQTLVAIDVNTKGTLSLDKVAFLLESALAETIFRKLGGLIVIDLPRYAQEKHSKAALQIARRFEDKSLQVLGFTRSGLLEITKERRQTSLTKLYQQYQFKTQVVTT